MNQGYICDNPKCARVMIERYPCPENEGDFCSERCYEIVHPEKVGE